VGAELREVQKDRACVTIDFTGLAAGKAKELCARRAGQAKVKRPSPKPLSTPFSDAPQISSKGEVVFDTQ
jgi:hypothetical protein